MSTRDAGEHYNADDRVHVQLSSNKNCFYSLEWYVHTYDRPRKLCNHRSLHHTPIISKLRPGAPPTLAVFTHVTELLPCRRPKTALLWAVSLTAGDWLADRQSGAASQVTKGGLGQLHDSSLRHFNVLLSFYRGQTACYRIARGISITGVWCVHLKCAG